MGLVSLEGKQTRGKGWDCGALGVSASKLERMLLFWHTQLQGTGEFQEEKKKKKNHYISVIFGASD